MLKIALAAVIVAALVAVAAQPAVAQQQNRIVSKKNCTPDACIKALRQRGYPFATAAIWCAANNNGC